MPPLAYQISPLLNQIVPLACQIFLSDSTDLAPLQVPSTSGAGGVFPLAMLPTFTAGDGGGGVVPFGDVADFLQQLQLPQHQVSDEPVCNLSRNTSSPSCTG